MGLPKQLSEQQKKFAELLVYNEGRKTPTECALEAGYAEGSAHVRASELRNPNKYPLVVKYIGEIRQEVQKKYEVTFEKHITELGRIREAALSKGAFSAAANAEHNLNLNKENLVVSEAFANQGPVFRRFRPRAKGQGFAIRKPTCHIFIAVKEKI